MFEIKLVRSAKSEGGALVIAFPSVGMVGIIAANFIGDSIKMARVGYVMSDDIPPAAIVQDGIPGYPIRLLAQGKLSALVSEFQIPPPITGQMARAVLDFTSANRFETIVCLEGLLTEQTLEAAPEARVFGVGSTPAARKMIERAGIEQFKSGMITGVSGALLSEGERVERDVVCLLADANALYPDARGAAKLVEAVTKLMPSVKVNLKELYEEAAKIEENVKATVEKTKELLAARQSQAERLGKSYMYG